MRKSTGQYVCSRRNSVSTATNGCAARRVQASASSRVVVIGRIGRDIAQGEDLVAPPDSFSFILTLDATPCGCPRLVDEQLSKGRGMAGAFTAKGKGEASAKAEDVAGMHRYRTHTCGTLRAGDIGKMVRLSGWVHRVRDHGGLLFFDLRGHHGLTQVVADPESPAFKAAEAVRAEWVIRVDGKVRARPPGTVNADLPTGEIELFATQIEVLSAA